MADTNPLQRFTGGVTASLRDEVMAGSDLVNDLQEPVRRCDGSTIDLTVTDSLMSTMTPRFYDHDWAADRGASDRWLAPRLHYALRLTRAEASDRGMWSWLAVRYSGYVVWRWSNDEGEVAEDRWTGPVHKQALMRLWWGGELFRNGGDYSPVERAFLRQDLPNSLLHRPLIRCRSLALAILDVVAPSNGVPARTGAEINKLAKVLNLAMAGSPPELETDFQCDDVPAYQRWLARPPRVPQDWDGPFTGPAAQDTTEASLSGGHAIARRGWSYAHPNRHDD